MKQFFSSYYTSDFGDLQKDVDLSDDIEMNDSEDKFMDVISYDDLKQIMNFHLTIIRNYTKTEWLNPVKDNDLSYDFVVALIEKYKIFGPILQKIINGLNYNFDTELVGSLKVLQAVTQRYGQTDDLGE